MVVEHLQLKRLILVDANLLRDPYDDLDYRLRHFRVDYLQ